MKGTIQEVCGITSVFSFNCNNIITGKLGYWSMIKESELYNNLDVAEKICQRCMQQYVH
jgi:hypothetical protein